MNDLLAKYSDQIKQDLTINELNIKEVSLLVPSKKHFWANILIQHKRELNKLNRERRTTLKEMTKKTIEKSPITISYPKAENMVKNSTHITDLDKKIEDEETLIEFLEKNEKIFSSLTWDVKNIIETIKLETL